MRKKMFFSVMGCVFILIASTLGHAANSPPYPPSNPTPSDGAQNISVGTTSIGWQGGDPDGGNVTYEVYFGTSSNPGYVYSQNENVFSFSYHNITLQTATTYYWKIVSKDSSDAKTSGPIWRFTTSSTVNHAPNKPGNPSPSNGSKDVSVTTALSWTGGDPDSGDAVTYYIYLGTDIYPLFLDATTQTTYNPGTLMPGTTYYWWIISQDSKNEVAQGDRWSFTTAGSGSSNSPPYMPGNPYPANGSSDISINTALQWTGGDPDGDAVTYDIYFGKTNNPQLILTIQNQTNLNLWEPLETGTTYYWKVISKDSSGLQMSGSLWTFTTGTGSTSQTRLAVDFGSYGLYIYDGSLWNWISGNPEGIAAWGDKLVANFSSYGLYVYNGNTWDRIGGNAKRIAAWGDKLVADFDSYGIYAYDGNSWNWLGGNAENIITWGDKLVADFGDYGIYVYNGSNWDRIGGNPGNIAVWNNKLVADFAGYGLYVYNGSSWDWISGNCENITAWGTRLAADFGAYGIYAYNGSVWDWIGGNAENITGWGNMLAADFGTYGLYIFDGSSWNWISGNPEDMEEF